MATPDALTQDSQTCGSFCTRAACADWASVTKGGGVRSVLQLPKGIDMSVPCTGFTTISTTYMSKQTQRINDISAAYVVVSFVSSEFMKRRLLK